MDSLSKDTGRRINVFKVPSLSLEEPWSRTRLSPGTHAEARMLLWSPRHCASVQRILPSGAPLLFSGISVWKGRCLSFVLSAGLLAGLQAV